MPVILTPIPQLPDDGDHRLAKWFISAAPARLIPWADAKTHLRLESDDEQTYVETLIDAATDYAEDRLSAALMPRTIIATFYNGEAIILPRGPVGDVLTVADKLGVSTADYRIEHYGHTARIVLNAGLDYPVGVAYRAGYAGASSVPAGIKLAVLAHVGTLYENRESVTGQAKTAVPHSLDDFYRLKSRNPGVG